MMPRRFKYEYHNSWIVSAVWTRDDELCLQIELDPTWNKAQAGAARVTVYFGGVRNRGGVQTWLESHTGSWHHAGWLAEIIAIERQDSGFAIDTSPQPGMLIACTSLHEI